jgi:hypothetical protein
LIRIIIAKKLKIQITLTNQDMQDITFKCLGDPDFEDYVEESKENEASEGNEESQDNQNDSDVKKEKFYTLDKLPGNNLIMQIKYGPVEYEICICGCHRFDQSDIQKLIDAQMVNATHFIRLRSGPNQEIEIGTMDGYTYFQQWGSGGDSPTQA